MTQMISVDNIAHFCYKCGNLTKDQRKELIFNLGTAYCSLKDETVRAKHTCKNWTRCK